MAPDHVARQAPSRAVAAAPPFAVRSAAGSPRPLRAILIVAGAIIVGSGLTRVSRLHGAELGFEWYLAAVALVAWRCGQGPALATIIGASIALDLVFRPHDFSVGVGLTDLVQLLVFLAVATLVTRLVAVGDRAGEERARWQTVLALVVRELRPMASVLRTGTSRLRSGQLPAGQAKAAVNTLARTAESVTRLVRDIEAWTRFTAGKSALHPLDLDLAEVARDAVCALEPAAEARSVTLSGSLASTWVYADPDHLRQLAMDMLSEELKRARAGDELVVSVGVAQGRGTMSVRGGRRRLPPPGASRRWGQATDRITGDGSGLRLALSSEFIRAQRGQLSVPRDASDGEAVACLELPVTQRLQDVLGPRHGQLPLPPRHPSSSAPPAPLVTRRRLEVGEDAS